MTTPGKTLTMSVEDARELTYLEPNEEHELENGSIVTVVATEDIDRRRWVSVHRLIFRDSDGQHWAGRYQRGLTEQQETQPWDGKETVTFQSVTARVRVVEITEYVRETTLGDSE